MGSFCKQRSISFITFKDYLDAVWRMGSKVGKRKVRRLVQILGLVHLGPG
jgi:hypothetical protein